MAAALVLGTTEDKTVAGIEGDGYRMSDLKAQARTCFMGVWMAEGNSMAWANIEFEKWWSNDRTEYCISKANKANGYKCYRPCEHCLLLKARKDAS